MLYEHLEFVLHILPYANIPDGLDEQPELVHGLFQIRVDANIFFSGRRGFLSRPAISPSILPDQLGHDSNGVRIIRLLPEIGNHLLQPIEQSASRLTS